MALSSSGIFNRYATGPTLSRISYGPIYRRANFPVFPNLITHRGYNHYGALYRIKQGRSLNTAVPRTQPNQSQHEARLPWVTVP